jgi:hypothetical protein
MPSVDIGQDPVADILAGWLLSQGTYRNCKRKVISEERFSIFSAVPLLPHGGAGVAGRCHMVSTLKPAASAGKAPNAIDHQFGVSVL